MIRLGYRLPLGFLQGTPHFIPPPPPTFQPPSNPQALAALDQEVASLLSNGATEEVLSISPPGFYGRIFVIPKSSGRWRPVLDLSVLNTFLTDLSFRMETPSSVRGSVHQGDWATSIDLLDAYFHILIHPRDRKWLRFVWRGRVFQFRALPFGLAPAPWTFTKVVRELCIFLRQRGVRLKVYLDDWLILASSADLCHRHTQSVLELCTRLGYHLNAGKSDLSPAQQFTFLGILFDTVHWLVRPADHHVTRLSLCISQLLHCPSAPAGLLATLLGLMESLAPLIPYGRPRKRALQRAFRARWSQYHQPGDALIPLGPWFLQAIAHWLDLSWVSQGVPISVPPPREELFTDASNRGWGAHMSPLSAVGLWSEVRSSGHINQLELEAVLLALQQFLPSAQGCHILLNTDNTTVACYINRQGGACSPTLSKRVEHLLRCSQHSIILTAKHIPGKLNVLADSLSRSHMILHTEWTLDSAVLAPVWDAWFCPLVDLFATRFNHKLPTFVSPVPDPAAWWWMPSLFQGRVFWPSPFLCSPFCRRFSGRPGKSKPHSSSLPRGGRLNPGSRSCCVSPMNLLSSSTFIPGLFSSPGQESHANPGLLDLHAWLLCGTRCLHQGLRRAWWTWSPRPTVWALKGSTPPHWSRWLRWSQDNQVDPHNPSYIQVANFLAFLSTDLSLSASSITVHRAAICTTLRQLGGPSLSDDPLFRDLVCSASIRDARNPRRTPSWDLFLVLSALRLAPYEPIREISLKFLTLKTGFLVALASGQRCSEVHAGLPSDVASEPDGSFSLRFLPEFLQGTLPPSSLSSPLPPFSALTTKTVLFAPSGP